jgi:hypothetical protein
MSTLTPTREKSFGELGIVKLTWSSAQNGSLPLQIGFPEQFDEDVPQGVRIDDDVALGVCNDESDLIDVHVAHRFDTEQCTGVRSGRLWESPKRAETLGSMAGQGWDPLRSADALALTLPSR